MLLQLADHVEIVEIVIMENGNRHLFCVETLESRCMLAGDVSVVERGGNLQINGDAGDNSLVIRATDQADQYHLQS